MGDLLPMVQPPRGDGAAQRWRRAQWRRTRASMAAHRHPSPGSGPPASMAKRRCHLGGHTRPRELLRLPLALTTIHPTGTQPGPAWPSADSTGGGIPTRGGTTNPGTRRNHRGPRSHCRGSSRRSPCARERSTVAAPCAKLHGHWHSTAMPCTRGKWARIRP